MTPPPDNKDTELEPCPFGGGEGRLMRGEKYWRAYCEGSPCPTDPMTAGHLTEAEAIAAWNTRVIQSSNAGLVEALRTIEGRVDYAIGMYHDATRWGSEDGPDGEGTLRDYVFAEVRQALAKHGDA
jgi:hypothetical protein